MALTRNWQERIGNQRDWVWRGWQTRYSYMRAQGNEKLNTPMIFLHGFGASIEHWRHNLPIISEQHTVYALDLLGFGASRKAATNYNVDLWVEQVYDFWRTFIGQPVVLVGNSIGSLVCLQAAVKYPEMVKGLVMLSLPDVSLRQEMIPQWLQPLVNTVEGLVGLLLVKSLFKLVRRPGVIQKWAGVAYVDKKAINDELVEILAAPPQDEGAARTFSALFNAVRQPSFATPVKKVLPSLKIPMLLIWGKGDRMIPPSLAPIFAALNPQIQLVELENVGHCPHDECPDTFNQILLNWLEAEFLETDDTQPQITNSYLQK